MESGYYKYQQLYIIHYSWGFLLAVVRMLKSISWNHDINIHGGFEPQRNQHLGRIFIEQVREFAVKIEVPSLKLRNYLVEGKNWLLQVALWAAQACCNWCIPTQRCKILIKNFGLRINNPQ